MAVSSRWRVHYERLSSLPLNELQKQVARVGRLEARLAALEGRSPP